METNNVEKRLLDDILGSLKLNNIGHIILYDLKNTSDRIKEKLNLIIESKLSYDEFQRFNAELNRLERFRIPASSYSDNTWKKDIANFVSQFEKSLDEFIETIDVFKTKSAKTQFFYAMFCISQYKELQEQQDVKILADYLKKIDKVIDSAFIDNENTPELSEEEVKMLQESKEIITNHLSILQDDDKNESVKKIKK